MSLRTPILKELKTELISVMDFFPPEQPNTDAAGNIVNPRSATTQSDEVRRAMTANMFVQLLEIIGNRTPGDIEASALILKEINNLLDEYEAAIGPMLNLITGNNSFISVVRQEVSDLTRNYFSSLTIPIDTNEIPSDLKYSILSPFHPVARIGNINESGNVRDKQIINNLIESIWGSFSDEGFIVATSPNFIRNFDSGITEFKFPFKYISLFADYLSQIKAASIHFPDAFNSLEGSTNSIVAKKAIGSNEIGILKPMMFDLTTSAAKGIITSNDGGSRSRQVPLISKFVTTDSGYERVFREAVGANSSLARQNANRENLDSWLNKPQNVLSIEAVSSLRDGFLSDTELAEELGLDSANLDPLQSEKYIGFTQEVKKERNDIFKKIKEIIVSSDLNSGIAGDFVPGISPETSIQGGSAFRNCNYIAIKEALGMALSHQGCVALAGLFVDDFSTILERFQGAQKLFGKNWHLASIREISRYIIGIITGKSTPRNTFVDYITGEVTIQDNADPSVEENLRRIDRINDSILELNSRKRPILNAININNDFGSYISLVRDFTSNTRAKSDLAVSDLTFIENSSNSHERYSSYVLFLFETLISTGYSRWTSVRRVLNQNSINIYSNDGRTVKDAYSIIITNENSIINGQPITVVLKPDSSGMQDALKSHLKNFLEIEFRSVSIKLLDRASELNSILDEINNQIEELEANFESIQFENAEFVVNSLVDNFPFTDTLSIADGFENTEDLVRMINSEQYSSFVGFDDPATAIINPVDYLDPAYSPESSDVEVPVESGFLTAINSVLSELILDCISRIQNIPIDISVTDKLNYAYAYFMLAGAFARNAMFTEVSLDRIEETRRFENKILTPERKILILNSSDQTTIELSALSPSFQRKYSNAIGLGENTPEGQIKDPYQDNLDYVKNLSNLLTQTLAPGFATASEALLIASQVLRRAFARSIAVGGTGDDVPLNILDFLLRANDFIDFSNRAKSFINQKNLVSVLLLSSNDVTASFSLLQYAIYVLTQSPLTKIRNFNVGSSEVIYNKVFAVGIHKNLEDLIDDILSTANVEAIKRDFIKIQILERQLDPSPSNIDMLAAGSNESIEYGSRYLQSTPSVGQSPGGFNYYIGLNQDYKFLVENFSLSIPVIKITKNIINPLIPRREFEVNLRTGIIREDLREDNSTIEPEVVDGIVTFIRSEALKIYYYYMTGLIFDPVFLPDPTKDDSIITRDLISSNPITRLRTLLSLISSSDINQFNDIVLMPFISDNDSIEEFSAKIKLLT